jgi:hypothetical protein
MNQPLATYRYILTWQDALAYERLPRSMRGIQQATLYIWLALSGIFLITLPPELVGYAGTPRFWLTGAGLLVLQYAIFRGFRAVARLNHARYRFPRPVEMEVVEEDDHLVVTTDGKTKTVPFEEIGMLLPTRDYLFMAVGRDLVIVPARAFTLPDTPPALAARIDAFMRDRYEGEAAAG